MHSAGQLTGTFGRKAMVVAGSAAALTGLGTATASAEVAPPQPHSAVIRRAESATSRDFHPQGGARRRSAFEPVRPKAITWPQAQLVQSHRADARIGAKSAPLASR
jgi:hypothetical protein